MPVKDARGFALVDETPAVIVLNTKDSIEARLFSLMHEFAHILLGESVIDLPDLSSSIRNRTETWCNNFSSMFFLLKIIAIPLYESNKTTLTNTETLNTLSRKYKVSKLMLLYNMLKLGFITKKEYNDIINRYIPKDILPSDKKEKKQGGGIPSDIQCLSKLGNKFISIVANNYDKKYITYTDALNYLSIKSKNFDKVLEKARK
ncbi:MAG: ImmA/IrrE family metallo-endopeptidase [DPANN group archaeon]|nr:ImmA/IrrE family metallo-endopeptidase [DPANN group archaeon]